MRILSALRELRHFSAELGRSGLPGPQGAEPPEARSRIRYRLARLEDMNELMAMWQQSVEEIREVDLVAAEVDLSKVQERVEFFEMLVNASDAGVMVAEVAEAGVVGMLTFQQCTNPGFFKILEFAFISSVHVKPQFRRQGIAQGMTEATLELLRRRGVQEAQLSNSPWNVAADLTWERLGFEIVTVQRRRLL
jgi:ribosomal protein S18 acetylase RimI-like enzyme